MLLLLEVALNLFLEEFGHGWIFRDGDFDVKGTILLPLDEVEVEEVHEGVDFAEYLMQFFFRLF